MKKWFISLVLGFILLMNVSHSALAYSGRTDRIGGHFVTKTHKYEFEHYTKLGSSAKNKQSMIQMIRSYNSNAYKHVVSVNTIDWSSYTYVYGKRLR